eukprot:TRINITY_DN389_c1_g1_i1.p1 TRINITY_DN389_c1_g1~~TRINITY_DN389_c1_g1_i1.p1  ORF type:complete len:2271 (-),score=715.31 TRINITY_DN389_c1_g1_i1:92-6904(-)
MDEQDEIRLMFVGKENTGKTSLIKALTALLKGGKKGYKKAFGNSGNKSDANGSKPEPPTSTEGIAQSREIVLHPKDQNRRLVINFWDFAGQEIYLATHPFFLSERCVYVVCFNINSEVETARIGPWLKTIKFYAPKSPILIVGTHLDTVKKGKKDKIELVKEEINEKFSTFKMLTGVFGVGIYSQLNVQPLLDHILETALAQPWYTNAPRGSDLIAEDFFQLNQSLCTTGEVPLLAWDDIIERASKVGVPEARVVACLKYIETLGHIMYFPGIEDQKKRVKSPLASEHSEQNNNGFIIIDPQWIIQLFSSVINPQNRNCLTGDVLFMHILRENIWRSIPDQLIPILLKLLEFFDIMFRFPCSDTLLVPSLLPDELHGLQSIWPAYNPNCIQLSRSYVFDFVPTGLFSRFVIRLMSQRFQSKCWRSGVFLECDGANVLVVLDSGANTISVTARGSDTENPVIPFCNIVELLNSSLLHQFQVKPKIHVPCPLCLDAHLPRPFLFKWTELEDLFAKRETVVTCTREADTPHVIQISDIAPDLAMLDFDSRVIDIDSEVTTGKVLGKGGFGTVYLGTFENNPVAVKVVHMGELPADADEEEIEERNKKFVSVLAEWRREVKFMSRLVHPNLVKLVGFSFRDPPAMVLELINCGDLHELINDPTKEIDWHLRMKIILDVVKGMAFLHTCEPPIVHCDLKSPNIMLKSLDWRDPVCGKVADLGLAQELVTESFKGTRASDRAVANPTWLAPEILAGKNYGLPSDVYALGIVLWELYTRDHPFKEFTFDSDKEQAIIDKIRPPIDDACPQEYSSMIKSCWDDDAKIRPTFENLLKFFLPRVLPILAPEIPESEYKLKNDTRQYLTIRRGSVFGATQRKQRRQKQEAQQREQTGTVGWKKHSISGSLVNRWRHNLKEDEEPHIVKQLVEVRPDLFICPSPAEAVLGELLMECKLIVPYKVFNLSSVKYDYTLFSGIVVEYPMNRDEAPTLDSLKLCVDDVSESIKSGNCAIIHDSGKGYHQTFLVTVCALMALVPNLSVEEAIKMFPSKPDVPNSYYRYINYYHTLLKEKGKRPDKTMHLHKVVINSIPNFKFTGGCDPHYSVSSAGKTLFISKNLKGKKGNTAVEFFTRDFTATNELSIEFFHKDKSHTMFAMHFNIAYESLEDRVIVFPKSSLEKFKEKRFASNFSVKVFLISPHELNATLKENTGLEDASESERSVIPGAPVEEEEMSFNASKLRTGSMRLSTNFRKSIMFEKEDLFDANLPVCTVCHKNVTADQTSLTIASGVIVHHLCMHCELCGDSFQGEAQSVVSFGRVICSFCDKDLNPTCTACEKLITTKPVTHAERNWHPGCLNCSSCTMPIEDTQNLVFSAGNALCKKCARGIPEVRAVGITAALSDREDKAAATKELQTFLATPLGQQFFVQYLQSVFAERLYEFCEEVEQRKHKSKAKREALSAEIDSKFLDAHGSRCLPPDVRNQVNASLKDATHEVRRYKTAYDIVFAIIADVHYTSFTTSNHFKKYQTALEQEIDPEEEDEIARRQAAKKFIGISAEDEEKYKKLKARRKHKRDEEERKRREEEERKRREQEEAERLRREEEERLRREEEERLRREEEAARLKREEEERLRREEEERLRREEEERLRLAEEERKRLEEEERRRRELEAEEERKRREEEERLRREEEERLRREEEERLRREEEERLRREEEERIRREEEERRRREEEERKRREEEEKRRKAEERKRKKEEERRRKEEEERRRREQEERDRREEELRRQFEEEKRRLEQEAEEERRKRAELEAALEAERRRVEEEERLRREEEERKRKEEERRKRKEEKRRKEEEARRKREEAERKRLEAEQRKREEEERRKKEEKRRKKEEERKRLEEEERRRLEEARKWIPTSEAGKQVLQRLGFVALSPNREVKDVDVDSNVVTDFKLTGSKDTILGNIHFVQLRPYSVNIPCILNKPEDYLKIEIKNSDGRKYHPYLRDNLAFDKTVMIGFWPESEGLVHLDLKWGARDLFTIPITISREVEYKDWILQCTDPQVGQVWMIKVCRVDGQPGAGQVTCTSTGNLTDPTLYNMGGYYCIQTTPNSEGPAMLHVKVDGRYILNSPVHAIIQRSTILGGASGSPRTLARSLSTQGYNPMMANPGMMNPMMANPGMMNPMMANQGMMNPMMANPGMMNPMMANQGMMTPQQQQQMMMLQQARSRHSMYAPGGMMPGQGLPGQGLPGQGLPGQGLPGQGQQGLPTMSGTLGRSSQRMMARTANDDELLDLLNSLNQ